MSARFGGQSMVEPLRRVLVKRPEEAFAVEDPRRWHYLATPDLAAARNEHDGLVDILRRYDVEILYHDDPQPDRADAIYVFDPALITDKGAVLLRMGKTLRQGEEQAMARKFEALGIPVRDALNGDALAEGGDLLWLDTTTLFTGLGFRTNAEGVQQLQRILSSSEIRVESVDLPYDTGPDACLHLLSLISLVDRDLAVVYPRLLPVRLWQALEQRGFRVVEVPAEEFSTMGTNVLALAPGVCLMLEGNPRTQALLETSGCIVHTYRGQEISLKAEGGPTCLTGPILRSP